MAPSGRATRHVAFPATTLPSCCSISIQVELDAVIEAGKVNAYRTAAADAVAADLLARKPAKVLAIFGAGNQAGFEVMALARIRPIQTVLVVARPSPRRDALVDQIGERGLEARAALPEEAVRAADIVVTATPSREPLFDAAWVDPGTHIVSMGSDAPGKRELPSEIFPRARLFCDLLSQSVQIGEFQHVRDKIDAGVLAITPIGDVIEKRAPGRRFDSEITVFDSSGISLQDLYMADALIRAKGPTADQLTDKSQPRRFPFGVLSGPAECCDTADEMLTDESRLLYSARPRRPGRTKMGACWAVPRTQLTSGRFAMLESAPSKAIVAEAAELRLKPLCEFKLYTL